MVWKGNQNSHFLGLSPKYLRIINYLVSHVFWHVVHDITPALMFGLRLENQFCRSLSGKPRKVAQNFFGGWLKMLKSKELNYVKTISKGHIANCKAVFAKHITIIIRGGGIKCKIVHLNVLTTHIIGHFSPNNDHKSYAVLWISALFTYSQSNLLLLHCKLINVFLNAAYFY